jgi:mRNA interferase RelE/StbE
MTSSNISFKPSVEKDLRQLPKSIVTRAIELIERLKIEPIPHRAIKLSGAERLYRIRVGDYRIVYEVDLKSKQVMIQYIRHRREVYRSK